MADFREWRGLPGRGKRLRGLEEMPIRTTWHSARYLAPRKQRRHLTWGAAETLSTIVLGVALGLAFAVLNTGNVISLPLLSTQTQVASSRQFGMCFSGGGTNCVVDGDTFWMDGRKIRIADIDTPETHPPRCAEEAALGAQATQRLLALLNTGPVTLAPIDRDTDRYGRALRIVTRDGQSLGATLVAEGLARPWDGARHPWCA